VLPATPPAGTIGNPLKNAQRATLHEMLRQHSGSRAALAAKLGISERSLYRKLKALDATPCPPPEPDTST